MTWRKTLRRSFIAFLGVIFALNAAVAHAEIYEGVGEYFMTYETVDFAKEQAELAAQSDILEQICVYVKEQSTMIDNELDNEEIITVSTGIIHVIDTKFSIEPEDALIKVKAFVTAQIDIAELKKLLEQEIKNKI